MLAIEKKKTAFEPSNTANVSHFYFYCGFGRKDNWGKKTKKEKQNEALAITIYMKNG